MKVKFPMQLLTFITLLSLVVALAPMARGQEISLAAANVTPNGLVLWNKLGSQSEVQQSAVGLGGTFKGGSFTPGMFGGAFLAFHNQNRMISFPKDVIPVEAGTIEIWAKLNDFPVNLDWGENPNLFKYLDTDHNIAIHLNGNDGTGIGGLCGRAGAGFSTCTGGYGSWTYQQALGGADPTQWHHYALVWDKVGIAGVENGTRKIAIFLDGKLNSNAWTQGHLEDFTPLSNGELWLMEDQNLNQGSVALDNLKIWNYAKTDFSDRFVEGETPQSLCTTQYQNSMVGYWRFDNASDPMQPTVGNLRGSVVGNTKTSTGIAGRALELDGQSYVNYGVTLNVPVWDQYTVSIWFKNDGRVPPNPGYGQKIIDKTTMYSDFYLSLQHWDSPGHFVYKTFQSPSGIVDPLYDGSIVVAKSPYLDNAWHHAIMVRNGKSGQLWVDGVLKGTNLNMQTVVNNQPLLLGYSLSPDSLQRVFWGGYLDEFALFNRALNAGEIGELYKNSAAGRNYCYSTPVSITIVQDSIPDSSRNFRFYGPFGEFRLDDPGVDDVDGIGKSMSYEVVAGNYGFSEMQVNGWRVTDILCSSPERATSNLQQHSLILNLLDGDNVTCTFVTKQAVTAYARSYWDKNANRRYDVNEPWKSGVWTEIFDSNGKSVAANFTDANGQVGGFNLAPGSYSVCQTAPSGWWNTQPAKLDPRYGKPCYSFNVAPAGLVTGYFGWINRPFVAASEDANADSSGLEVTVFETPDEEESGNSRIYLPMIVQ